MSQFYAYKNPNPATHAQYPYLLDVQSDLLSELRTTVVIPLTPSNLAASRSLTRLNPTITFEGKSFTLMTQEIAGVDRNQIGAQAYDLSPYRSEIVAAIDFVLSGI
ncbi:CcdB family protein [Nitrincola tapanii]|jgi:toxin CcdB|uniref:Toxin CcdB n=1 Tax=Nitrincola tapanii TaxID=1708751 RepID=A0A5A9W762_9GAMM|nr:CcdB family protein [Nitrincola tapanii]KAA0876363.1 plasmid maintenance protein CcdB [Nitrincola tapanii]